MIFDVSCTEIITLVVGAFLPKNLYVVRCSKVEEYGFTICPFSDKPVAELLVNSESYLRLF